MAALMSRLSALAIAPCTTIPQGHIYDNARDDNLRYRYTNRAAVSRCHQTRKFFEEGQGVNHNIHDFPTAELGLKMAYGWLHAHVITAAS